MFYLLNIFYVSIAYYIEWIELSWMQISSKLQKNSRKHNWNFQIRKIIGGKNICRGGPQAHPPLQMDFQGRAGRWPAPENEFQAQKN